MRRINIFTRSFPLGKNETFLDSEVYVANLNQYSIRLVPVVKDQGERKYSVDLHLGLASVSFGIKLISFLKLLISKWLWLLPFQGAYAPKAWRHYYCAVKYLYASFCIKEYMIKNKRIFQQDDLYYSYWFNYICLGLVLAKIEDSYYSQIKIVSRGHGYDVFTDIRDLYFPYRDLVFREILKVYSVSENGENYLKKKYPDFSSKISVSKLGVLQYRDSFKANLFDGKNIAVVSCSSIIELKRVDLIYDSLLSFCKMYPEFNISWTHFGDGVLKAKLENHISNNRISNLEVTLSGYLSNTDILKRYSLLNINAFVNLSTSEGIPVSIMEAISFGIPIMATDVGGTNEIVTKDTGILLPVNFTSSYFNASLLSILNNKTLSESAFSFYVQNYSALQNYSNFYSQLKVL